MFITQPKEIMEAYPTARLDTKDAQRLLRSIEEEEYSMLSPLLGEGLMMTLYSRYREYCEYFGGITTDYVDVARSTDANQNRPVPDGKTEEFLATVPLLRDIQSALVYRTFSNKIYSLSTSLNLGGGANRASAGDYDPADDKHIQELRRELWMNHIHACDNILVKLERDAKGEKRWLNDWKDSDGYFMKEDTLFPTMRDLKKFYPCDQPTRFLAVQPLLMYCQNTYITPRVNEIDPDIMERLLDPSVELSNEEQKAKKLLRIALSYHMQAHQAGKASAKNATPFSSAPTAYSITPDKTELAQSADSAMSTAIAYIEKHLVYANVNANVNVDADVNGDAGDNGGNNGKTRCNAFRGHEDHVADRKFYDPEIDMHSQQCGCQGTTRDGDYSTFTSLYPDGLNRW